MNETMPQSDAVPGAWPRSLAAACRVVLLGVAPLAILKLFRVFFIAAFHDRVSPGTGMGQYLAVMANGGRVDLQTVAWLFLPAFLAAVLLASVWPRVVRVIGDATLWISLALILPLGVITWGFIREYDDQFNHFVLGVVFDDFGAVLRTVWKGNPVVWASIALVVAGWLIGRGWLAAVARLAPGPERIGRLPRAGRVILSVALLLALVASARGSIGTRPMQRKDFGVAADPFLNKMVTNPAMALMVAVGDYRRMADAGNIRNWLADGDIRGALRRAYGQAKRRTIDGHLARTASGAASPPRHVFVVVMESASAWPLFEQYRALGLTPEMERLGREGVLLTSFLPGGAGTMSSLNTILTGLADPGIPVNYQVESRKAYPTGLAATFRRLGYRTRLFYGGYLSWERVGDFAREQGFDEVYGGGNMGSWAEGNEWGVPDERLFPFVLETVTDDRPSLDVILTVSNHPPFDTDVYGAGFPLREMPASLKSAWDGSYTLAQMGHYWYADRLFGGFVDEAERRLPGVLVAATADHYGRRFLNGRPGLAERSLVPFLLHGPGLPVDRRPAPGAVGSHLDIAATLVELAAPAGFRYHAQGRDLLAPGGGKLSFGADRAVGKGFVAEFRPAPTWAPLPGAPPPGRAPDLGVLERIERDVRGIAWWRVMRGNKLPDDGAAGEGEEE